MLDRQLSHNERVHWVQQTECDRHAEHIMGMVVGVSAVVDLELVDGTVIKGVDTKDLSRLRPICVEDIVVQGSWVGRVVDLDQNVTVELENGFACKILGPDVDTLVPCQNHGPFQGKRVVDEACSYYPGQVVRVVDGSVPGLDKAIWSGAGSGAVYSGGKRRYQEVDDGDALGTVVAVETGAVSVDWIRHRGHDDIMRSCDFKLDDLMQSLVTSVAPDEKQENSRSLIPVVPFLHTDMHLNLMCLHSSTGSVARIVDVASNVDVLWANGDTSRAVSSRDLIGVGQPDESGDPAGLLYPRHELDFWVGRYVCEQSRRSCSSESTRDESADGGSMSWETTGTGSSWAPRPRRTGVVQSIDLKSGTAAVRWAEHFGMDGDVVLGESETVGIAELQVNRHMYGGSSHVQLGEIVFRISLESDNMYSKATGSSEGAVHFQEPWVGYIHGFTIQGEITVCWEDGTVSSVKPSQVKIHVDPDPSLSPGQITAPYQIRPPDRSRRHGDSIPTPLVTPAPVQSLEMRLRRRTSSV